MSFGSALSQMGNLFVLMLILMLIFSLLGMQLFGGMYNPSTGYSDVPCPGGVCPNAELEEPPHYHFDYIVSSTGSNRRLHAPRNLHALTSTLLEPLPSKGAGDDDSLRADDGRMVRRHGPRSRCAWWEGDGILHPRLHHWSLPHTQS